ncbi:hypothetical protein DKM44_13385 [Deinococcus irradiatisoli]|uniref:Adhesin domain-containing protein n=1 Tax=Deinococcus irradiatisoli TaxID=2202254 RepID=A0A2Z3JLH3_9DEIO|nr:hypothetical protein [Deinococcus irradiatisoli]AWN24100.1 hypothetical protein DKM44_13385 [Deinococcus irradiatisoli]
MSEEHTGGQHAADQQTFRRQVETLVAQGKLTPEEAADLLGEDLSSAQQAAPVSLDKPAEPQPPEAPTPPAMPSMPSMPAAVAPLIGKLVNKLVKEVAPHQESATPDDLRLDVAGYSLIVSTDPSLSAPVLSGETEGLSLRSSAKGWSVEQERGLGLRFGSRRATLSLPFTPRHVRAEVAGGQVVLPDITGELQADVSGGNLRVGDVGHLKAEISGGNLNAGAVAGNLHLEINGGNGKVERSQTLIAEINGGMLNWNGLLSEGQHRVEVNGGAANLTLEAGSSVQLSAEVTVGQLVSNFPTSKRGGMLNASYIGTLNGGAAGLSCQVSAGQIRLNADEVQPGGVSHA